MQHELAIPSPGFGTFRLEGESLKNAINNALESGYRHIDTAQIYRNETDVGAALKHSKIARKDIFLTTKVWIDNFSSSKFEESVLASLKRLDTDYVDLLLIHWPSPNDKVPMDEYLKCLNDCIHKGYTRSIGVSNFTAPLLERAFSILGKENIAVNQIEVHPHFQNRELVTFCQRNGLQVVGYMPLGKGKVLEDGVLKRIADKHKVTATSIALAWQIQQNIIPIPASTNAQHIQANYAAKEIRLSPEEMQEVAKVDTKKRLIDPDFAPEW
jgi:2,5-diketo-D-gluconate reductase B